MNGEFDRPGRSYEVAAELRGVATARRARHKNVISARRSARKDWSALAAAMLSAAALMIGFGATLYHVGREHEARVVDLSANAMSGSIVICCDNSRDGWFDPRDDDNARKRWFTGKGGPYSATDLMGRRL